MSVPPGPHEPDPAHVEEIFDLVVALPDSEQGDVLDLECAGDLELRQRVAECLRAHHESGVHPFQFTLPESPNAPAPPPKPAGSTLLVGTAVGNYIIARELGRGGMGVVYEAKHVGFEQRAVIKMLHTQRGNQPDAVKRLKNEANALARIKHPGIVHVYGFGEHTDGCMYIVLELLDGPTLAARLYPDRVLPQDTAVSFTRQIARALAEAHALNIIHRDLKPANLVIVRDTSEPGGERIKLLDFGIAKIDAAPERMNTKVGDIMGTPEYMAPEQCRGQRSEDARTDLYALGVILFRMLTGRLPFFREDRYDYLIAHVQEPAPAVTTYAPHVHPELADIISRLLAKEPDARFQTADAVVAALGAMAQNADQPDYQPDDRPADIASPDPAPPRGLSTERFPYHQGDSPNSPAPSSARTASTVERAVLGHLWDIPAAPVYYVPRQEMTSLSHALLNSQPGAKLGLHGMGGMGKSVLAAAVARTNPVRARFDHGVYWIALGQTPALTDIQARLANLLQPGAHEFHDPDEGAQCLRALFAGRRALIILDDVWDSAHVKAFDVVDDHGRIFLSTRNLEVLVWLDQAEEYTLRTLTSDEALELLACWTGGTRQTLGQTAVHVARACGYLPLALTVIGALLRLKQTTWKRVLEWLENADLWRLKAKVPTYPYPNVLAALEVSVAALVEDDTDTTARSCYHDLAVFPLAQPIPRSVLHVLWSRRGHDEDDTDALVGTLVARALATLAEPVSELRGESHESSWTGKAALALHHVLHSYVVAQNDDMPSLHGELIDAYAKLCPKGLAHGPTHAQGYFFRRLPYHLAHAGRHHELCQLLGDYHWLYAKCCATSPAELLADFEFLSSDSIDETVRRQLFAIRDAVQLSSHVLTRDPRQLPSQLLGRLQPLVTGQGAAVHRARDILDALLRDAAAEARFSWLHPLRAKLTPPGTALVCTITGHQSGITAIAVSSRRDQVVSASSDCTLRTWELPSGREIARLEGHIHWILDLALSADGCCLVSGSADRTVKVWDTERGVCLCTLTGHNKEVSSVAMTTDAQRVISGTVDGDLKLWDISNRQAPREIRQLAALGARIDALLVTHDNRRVVAGCADGWIRVWDLATAELVHAWPGHDAAILALTATRDSTRLVSGARDGSIHSWDIGDIGDIGGIGNIGANGEGSATRARLASFSGHERAVFSLAVSADGKRLVSGSADRNVAVWQLDGTGDPLFLGQHAGPVNAVALTPDDRYAISGSQDRTLEVWSMSAAGARGHRPAHTLGVSHIVTATSAPRAISSSWDKSLATWDLDATVDAEAHTSAITELPDEITALAMNPSGTRALSASIEGTLSLWDLATGQRLYKKKKAHGGEITNAIVIPGTNNVLTASCDHTLRIWNMDSGARLRTLSGHGAVVQSVVVSPDGKYALSGSYDKTVRLWDLDSGRNLRTLVGHRSVIEAAVMTPDGRWAVSAGREHALYIWDLQRGDLAHTVQGHTSAIEALAITPDGRSVLSASHDTSVRLWDLPTGKARAVLEGHTDRVIQVTVSADSTRALTVSVDGTVRLWHLDSQASHATFTGQGAMTACAFHPHRSDRVLAGDASGHMYILDVRSA